jgi:signal transduction histidine kinase
MRQVGGDSFKGIRKKPKSVILSEAKNLFSYAFESRFFASLRMTFMKGGLQSSCATIVVIALCVASVGLVQAESENSTVSSSESILLTQGKIILTDSEAPPPDSALWQPQSLPDNWNASRPGIGGFAWYRIEFELKSEQLQLSALYVPRVSMNGAVIINGEFLGGGGRFTEPMARQWYRPQFYSVPDKLLKHGKNVIHYRIKTYPNNKGGLSEINFGFAQPIEEKWRKRYFWQVTSVQITSVLTFSLGAMALLAWYLRRWNTAYGYCGASAVVWAIRNTHFFITYIPIPPVYWEIFVASSLIWAMLLAWMFGLRFANLYLPIAERLVFGFAIASPLLLWVAGEMKLTFAISLCYGVVLLIVTYLVKVVFDLARRERTVDAILLFCATIVVYSFGAHDWITQRDIMGFSEPYNMHFSAPIFFIIVAWNMFKRFTSAQEKADELTRSLETRVQQKSAELERTYEDMRATESTRMLTLERERIMRDMHDGVGSQLIAARQLAERGELKPDELATVLNECMDDLRLVIDSLEPTEGDLLNVIGNLRYRLTDRFARQGIDLRWEVSDFPANVRLAPSGILHILRIVQEAFANVLKHANASEVTFSATLLPEVQQVQLRVRDNGGGMLEEGANGASRGRGLANMKQRAEAVGGELHIKSDENGCVVMLMLPLLNPPAPDLT